MYPDKQLTCSLKHSDTEMFYSLMKWVVPPFSSKQKTWSKRDSSPGREKHGCYKIFFLRLLKKLCAAKKEVSLKFCSTPLITFTRMPIPESCWGADMPAVAAPEVTCSSYSARRLKWKIHPEFTCFPWGKEQELLIRQLMTEKLI